MKCLVTGAQGQLGSDLVVQLKNRGHEVLGTDVKEMDIAFPREVEKVFAEFEPEVVFHCAAFTAVDQAETDISCCRRVNVTGTENIAKACAKHGSKVIYLSTDYVFDGEGTRPWEPEDACAPLNVYGQTKYEGELAIKENLENYFIVRISWVFGNQGKNFIKTMLHLAENNSTITVVNDQYGSPTYTWDLARLLIDMAESDKYGIYHATNQGIITWFEFAKEIFSEAGIQVNVIPVSSKQFAAAAKRPSNSRMDQSKLVENGFTPLPTWQDALKRYIKQL